MQLTVEVVEVPEHEFSYVTEACTLGEFVVSTPMKAMEEISRTIINNLNLFVFYPLLTQIAPTKAKAPSSSKYNGNWKNITMIITPTPVPIDTPTKAPSPCPLDET